MTRLHVTVASVVGLVDFVLAWLDEAAAGLQFVLEETREQRRPARALFLAGWWTAPVPVRF